jgi:hypothetical protein
MRRIEKYYFIIMVAGILGLAVAFNSAVFAAGNNPCTKDIAKYCKNVKSDNSSVTSCLEEHEGELSQECRNYEVKLENPRGERRETVKVKMRFQRNCGADIMKFCKDTNPGKGGIVKCIYKYEKKVSATCKEWIKADKEENGKTK